MNTMLHAMYDDPRAAAAAADQLRAIGVPATAIQFIAAPPAVMEAGHDHVGSFADRGPHAHTPERDHLGSFADRGPHAHTPERDHVGSFADRGPHAHTPERDHVGSFAEGLTGAEGDDLLAAIEAAGVPREIALRYRDGVAHGAAVLFVRATGDQAAAAAEIVNGG